MITNVLVTGANGQLAQTIHKLFNKNENQINFTFVNKQVLDITNENAVYSYFSGKEFDYCINCAAYTNVEQAEISSNLALQVNAEGVKYLVLACEKEKVILIHISTDYVFDGKKNTPYTEDDLTNPINEYGKSKLKGEHYIFGLLEKAFVIRTSWLYSSFGKNFVKTIVNKINEDADLKVTIAETGTPTSCIDLANIIYYIITQKNIPYGLYHFSNEGEATWYDFAREIATYFKDYNKEKITKVAFFETKAERPKYSVLSKDKWFQVLNYKFNDWRKSLRIVIEELKET